MPIQYSDDFNGNMLTRLANGLTYHLDCDAENRPGSARCPAPRARLTNDADAWAQTSWFTLSDAPHTLEVDWRAATSAGANDGGLTFWIDGTQQGDLSGVDNDTQRIESARLGLVNGVPTDTRGTFYFDGFEARRSTYIGYAAPGGQVARVSVWQELAGFLRGLFGGSVSTAGIPAQPRPQPLPAARQPLAAPLEVMFAPPVKRANPAPPAQGANITVTYTYNGDGQRVMASDGTTTTVYVGNYFEWNVQAGTMTRYYYAGAERIAMRSGTGTGTTGLAWILGDHLGSTAITVDAATGAKLSEIRYKPWGEVRYEWGVTGTKYRFQGQRSTEFDLYDFNARFFDVYLNRWTQPDQIIPDPYNPLDWDRYQFVRSNPLKYVDPTGHCSGDPSDPENPDKACWDWIDTISNTFENIDIDSENWTAKELEAVWNALIDHIFQDEFLTAKSITLFRKDAHSSISSVGGETVTIANGVYEIYMYDFAYRLDPTGNGKAPPSIDNFRGNVAHEFAHVAIFQDPSIKDSYENARGGWRLSNLGGRINWRASPDQTAERAALVAATYEVDPGKLSYKFALIVSVSWEYTWASSFGGVCSTPR